MYKLKHENDISFTVQHPNGKSFTVAKKGLSPKVIDKIRGYADGGEIPPPDEPVLPTTKPVLRSTPFDAESTSPSTSDQRVLNPAISSGLEGLGNTFSNALKSYESGDYLTKPLDKLKDFIAPTKGSLQAETPSPESTPPQTPQSGQEQTQLPTQSGQEDKQRGFEEEYLKNPLDKSFEMQKSGVEQEQKAQSQLANSQIGYLSSYLSSAKKAQETYADTRKRLTTERDKAYENTVNQKIDPHQYWNSKSTSGKVGAIIGMAIAGIGQGLQGSDKNTAIDMINKQIDRDIEAQKKNMDQKNNLFKHNLERLKDEDEAYAVTRNQMAAMSAAQLQLAAAKSGDPMAKARATQLLGGLQKEYDVYNHQLALQKAQLGSADPTAARISLLLPKEQHEHAFKELGEYTASQEALKNADSIYDKLNNVQRVPNRVGNPIQSASDLKAANSSLAIAFMKNSPVKRYTPEVAEKLVTPYTINLTDDATRRASKRQGFKNLLRSEAEPTPILSSHGFIPKSNGPVNKLPPVIK